MKKIFTVLIMTVMAMQLSMAGDRVTRNQQELPEQARNFIEQHFPDAQISYIKIDREFLRDKDYEVVLTNGYEIEFDRKGEWKDVDCKKGVVPAAIIPAAISEYILANFENSSINQIERDRYGYEVELQNDLTVEFDKRGKFRRLDD